MRTLAAILIDLRCNASCVLLFVITMVEKC